MIIRGDRRSADFSKRESRLFDYIVIAMFAIFMAEMVIYGLEL